MSNTVPELRLDKNGKWVTRHVKSNVTERWVGITPPQQRQQEKRVEALREDIAAAIGLYSNSWKVESVRTESLPALARLVKSYDYSTMYDDLIHMGKVFEPAHFKKCVLLIEEHQETAISLLSSGNYSDGKGDMIMLVTGTLRHNFRMTKEQRAVLIEGVCRLWGSDAMEDFEYLNTVFPKRGIVHDSPVAIADGTMREDIAKFIVDHPAKLDTIIDLIGNRGISDVVTLKKMIDSSAADALSDGVL